MNSSPNLRRAAADAGRQPTPARPTFTPLAEFLEELPHQTAQTPLSQHTQIPRLENFHFHSALLPDDRVVSIYLPREYDIDLARRFPVFYLQDGQNLFDPQTSYLPGRTWRAGEIVDEVVEQGRTAPVILVGVANTGLRRMAEYTPTRDFRLGGGEGRRYGRLLIEELKPFIDRAFRTLPDPANTGLGGSSLGGLITLFLGFEHPDVFSRLAVVSPSLWWNQRSILRFVEQQQPSPRPRIWLDIGTGEGAQHVRDTERLNRSLIGKGWKPGEDLRLLIVPGAVHDEDAWASRFDRILSFLFPQKHSL